jgi:GNAT superfamily N-acetyltransferase
MQLRIGRHTRHLDEVTRFYRDRIGLPEIGGFREHDGYDGVFLALPGSDAHLEFTSGGSHDAPVPHPESLLVLYLGSHDAVEAVRARIDAEPVASANPYWAEHGLTFEDPDGFRIVLVPESFPQPAAAVRVELHRGPRSELRALFALAEDSAAQLDSYLDCGRVLVGLEGDQIVGHLQLTDAALSGAAEIKNMAVLGSHRRRGIGRALVATAVELARQEGRGALLVGTAAADLDNLRFYQRAGFRLRSIERDAFTPASGYAEDATIDGIELRDRVWLDLPLDAWTTDSSCRSR